KRAHALNENVCFHRWPTNRVWTRDSGCTFVFDSGNARARTPVPPQPRSTRDQSPHPVAKNATRVGHPQVENKARKELAAIKWRFNAWAKYPNWQHDDKIGSLMAQAAGSRELRPTFGKNRVVLEGGSIDV